MGKSSLRSLLTAAALVLAATTAGLSIAAPAQAAPLELNFNNVTGTVHLAKPNVTAEVPKSVINTTLDLTTGTLTGQAHIPDITVKLTLFNLLPVTSVVRIVPDGDLSGTVDLGASKLSTTTRFTIKLVDLHLDAAPSLNLAPSTCQTSQPTSLTLVNTTPIDIWNGTTVEGDYEIPSFSHCGLLTPLLTLLMAGPGNHMMLVLK